MGDVETHEAVKQDYGSDRAELVYGETADGKLVHIRTVERGLKCGCVCPDCKRPLVAKTKADKVTPHFAHHGPACGGGPETALHKLAKQIIAEKLVLVVPERVASYGGERRVLSAAKEIKLTSARVEYTDPKQIVPDLYVTVQGRELFVEIAVTHPCGEEKIQRLHALGIAALEIDLSKVARDAPPDEIANIVLHAAPRKWLFNQTIIDAVSGMRKAAEEKAASDRQKLEAEVQGKITDYETAIRDLAARKEEVPYSPVLAAVGLLQHVGIEVAGFGCFSVPPAVWQAKVLAEVLYGDELGKQQPRAVPIAKYLENQNLIRPAFKWIGKILEEAIITRDERFAAPWRAVEGYLNYLADSGVVGRLQKAFYLKSDISKTWSQWVDAEAESDRRVAEASEIVDRILGHLTDEERGDLTAEKWLDIEVIQTGDTYRASLRSDDGHQDVEDALRDIDRLFSGKQVSIVDFAGLPIRAAVERQLAAIVADEAKRIAKRKQDRLNDARAEALELFNGLVLEEWLTTPLDALDGRTPLQAAGDSTGGLIKVREVLSSIARQRRIEESIAAEAQRCRNILTREAEQRLGDDARSFLRGQSEDLNNLPPIVHCKDEATLREARRVLVKWEQLLASQKLPF